MAPRFDKTMSQNRDRPKQYDAVLGLQAQAPLDGIVLGGLEGIKRRLLTKDPKTQVAALCETLKYGEAGARYSYTSVKIYRTKSPASSRENTNSTTKYTRISAQVIRI